MITKTLKRVVKKHFTELQKMKKNWKKNWNNILFWV